MRRAPQVLRPARRKSKRDAHGECGVTSAERLASDRNMHRTRQLPRHAAASFVLLALLTWSPVVWGQVTLQAPRAPAEPARIIPLESVPDDKLEARIRQTFAHIEAFRGIQIDVADGVVRLSGAAERALAAQKAEELAARFEGVAHVINDIQAQAELERRLAPALRRLGELGDSLVASLPVLAVALAVLLAFAALSRLLLHWGWLWERLGAGLLLRNILRNLTATLVLVAGVLLALQILDLTALVGAVIGAAGLFGLALGFAFRDVAENYLSGMLLGLRSPFGIGDYVSVGDLEGGVLRLTSRELILITLDGNHVRIPNAEVFKNTIVNYTRNPRRRFGIEVGVGTGENLRRVQEVGCAALAAMKGVMEDPPPVMFVEELGEYNVIVRFHGWVDQRQYDFLKVRSEAKRILKDALDEEGVVMPMPMRDILMRQPEPIRAPNTAPHAAGPGGKPPLQEEARQANVSREEHIDKQIKEELAVSDEENLLQDRNKPGKRRH